MGVPGFFLWLIKKYNSNNLILKKLPEKIDYLMLDSNCLFHPKCFEIVNEHNGKDNLEELMFKNIVEYFDYLIELTDPTKGVYIAVDGTAPMAKIKQQRQRRFKTIADKKLFDKIKKKHGKEISFFWNNSAITPGTLFMEKLHKYILNWIEKKNNEIEIIYSSYKTPGEGEHKLLDYIKLNGIENKYIIYGLDADLIFLSLVSKNKIYLLRENTQINKDNTNEMMYVNIQETKELIFKMFKQKIKYEIKLDNIINDFIFICYLIGNDFLPHIPSLNIKNYGLEYLIETYYKIFMEINTDNSSLEYIINNKNININFFSLMMKYLSNKEDEILKSFIIKVPKNNSSDPYEKEMFKIENLQIKIEDEIRLGEGKFNDYRKRYYKHYWDIESEIELEEFSSNMVKEYLKGLKWITEYYFDKCNCWSWYYPYDHPPFITDIYKYINNVDINNIIFNNKNVIDPIMQLLIVLPIQSKELLPKIYKEKIIKLSEISYLYPISIKQDFLNKNKYWMGIPILPPLNIKLIEKFYIKYKDQLSEEEKKLNIKENIFIYKK